MYTVYKTTNLKNNRYYIGAHKTENPNDDYLGSGLAIKRAIKYYGRSNFIKEVLFVFQHEDEMYQKERELVEQNIENPLCYNLMEGGIGGFDHINSNRHIYQNPMKNPEVVRRNLESRSNGYSKDEQRVLQHRQKRLDNLKKAVEKNTGSKRPEHSILMQEKSKLAEMWKTNRETMIDSLSGTYEITTPDGNVYTTNRLGLFCEQHTLPFVTMWGNIKSDLRISKGRAKGYKCKILNN
jgi:hypothetical protein